MGPIRFEMDSRDDVQTGSPGLHLLSTVADAFGQTAERRPLSFSTKDSHPVQSYQSLLSFALPTSGLEPGGNYGTTKLYPPQKRAFLLNDFRINSTNSPQTVIHFSPLVIFHEKTRTIEWNLTQKGEASLFLEQTPTRLDNNTSAANRNVFVGDDDSKRKRSERQEKWMARYLELVLFQKKHGHTKVPNKCPEFPKLAIWQKFQRQQWKRFVQGKHSQLTKGRIKLLEKIGFIGDARAVAWESHFDDLKRFKEKNGHVRVIPMADTVLSQWVKRQRKQYKKFRNGDSSSLTQDRIDRLNNLGFLWDGNRQPSAWIDETR